MASFLPAHRMFNGILVTLAATVMLWAYFGHLDIIISASGKLVPQKYVQISQAIEAGRIKELLVKDGESVKSGQPLIRLDAVSADKDVDAILAEYVQLTISQLKLKAELANQPFIVPAKLEGIKDYPSKYASLLATLSAQHLARLQAYDASIQDARYTKNKTDSDLQSALEKLSKLSRSVALVNEQGVMWDKLSKEGFVARAAVLDKLLPQTDLKGELDMQKSLVESAKTASIQAKLALDRVTLEYRRTLTQEQSEQALNLQKITAELAKREHRATQFELKAPTDGVISGINIKGIGQVVQSGAPLLSLVPKNEPLIFEGWLKNEDAGYVTPGMPIKVKLATYPFQKYGWLTGEVTWVGADAETPETMRNSAGEPLFYRIRGLLHSQSLKRNEQLFQSKAGMAAVADIQIGDRSPFEYLTSPLKKVILEAAHEK